MADDKKISELSVASSLVGTETIEIVQGGVNKSATAQQIADLGSTDTPTITEVLVAGNDASGLVITNIGTPVSAGDAANKQYVDSVVPGTLPNIGDVLSEGNDAGGVTITNLPAPSASSDAATKDYVDSVSSGSFHLADFTTITQASPTQVDCNSLKEPKFYLELSSDTTLNITELRSDDTLNAYTTILFRIRKKIAGDVVITLDTDYNNFDLASDATITTVTLSGADEKVFWLTAVVYGLASSCDIGWNLVSTATGGGGGAVDSVNGATGVVVLDAGDIGSTATGNLAATNVQAALAELDSDLTAHITDSTSAHVAAAIGYTAGGGISATDVQAAISELDTEKVAKAGAKVIQLACSDETTALTTGTNKIRFRMPYAMTVTAVRASLSVAQTTGSLITVDINEGGTTILSTKLTFDNNEKTTTTAATPAVVSDTSLADDAEISVDIDQVGASTIATGLKVTIIGT